jgi:hypothetical protein
MFTILEERGRGGKLGRKKSIRMLDSSKKVLAKFMGGILKLKSSVG